MAISDDWLSKLLVQSNTYNAHFHQEKVLKIKKLLLVIWVYTLV